MGQLHQKRLPEVLTKVMSKMRSVCALCARNFFAFVNKAATGLFCDDLFDMTN